MTAIGILGTGSYLPDRVVGNEEMAGRVGVEPEWIERKTGILERRYVAAHEATSDLAVRAAQAAVEAAASVPISLHAAVRAGQVRPDDVVLMTAFGGGMSMGGLLLRWSAARVEPARPRELALAGAV